MDKPTEVTRQAVEFLMLWIEPGMDARQRAAAHISNVLGPDETGRWSTTIAGLLNLSMLMVVELAKERGAVGTDAVTARAQEILRDLSLKLPE
jgi:hypothetical protein